MPQAEDGVEKDGPSAPEGGSKEEEVVAPQPDTDWKALFEKESKEKEEWKTAALKSKRQSEESKSKGPDETEDERVARLASEVSARVVSTVTEDSLLKSKVTDPEQRKLVKFYLENRIKRTGTSEEALESDIETALLLANGKKIAFENEELKRMNNNDSRVAPTAGSDADRGVIRKPHQWTPEQEKSLEKRAKDLKLDPEKFKADAWKNRGRTNVA